MSSDVLDRVAELETRYTLQQDLVDKLSAEIFRQQRELDELGVRLAALERRMSSIGHGGGEDAPPDDVPPHY